jgi:serine/threonine-protein kinase
MHFSPDGKRLVFANREAFTRNDIWVQDLERNTLTRLTSSGGNVPIWSSDGKYILFSNNGLYWTRSDGGGEPVKVDEYQVGQTPSISPNGKQLVFGRENPWPVGEVLTASIEGTPDRPVFGKREIFIRARGSPTPALSPDGHWVAYDSSETGTEQVYVQPFPAGGGKVPISTDGGRFPQWSLNGRELFFCSPDHRIMVADYRVRGDSFLSGKPRVWSTQQILFNASGGPFLPYAVGPGGKRFAVMLYPDGTTEQHNPRQLTFLLNFTDELRRRVPE